MSTAADVLVRLQKRSPAYGLPGDFYRDPGIYSLELNLLFYREWLFAAHSVELGQTGSYLTLQVGDYPILLTRDRDGQIHGFVNSCRHRGARVCQEAHGVAPKLVCPYHQWTYKLDGRLFAARQMGPDFDKSQFRLRKIHCETVAGYIFICIAPEPPDFSATRRHLEPYILPHRLSEARVAFRRSCCVGALADVRNRRSAQRVPALDGRAGKDLARAADVSLPEYLESFPGRSRDLVPGAAPGADTNSTHHQVAGTPGCRTVCASLWIGIRAGCRRHAQASARLKAS